MIIDVNTLDVKHPVILKCRSIQIMFGHDDLARGFSGIFPYNITNDGEKETS